VFRGISPGTKEASGDISPKGRPYGGRYDGARGVAFDGLALGWARGSQYETAPSAIAQADKLVANDKTLCWRARIKFDGSALWDRDEGWGQGSWRCILWFRIFSGLEGSDAGCRDTWDESRGRWCRNPCPAAFAPSTCVTVENWLDGMLQTREPPGLGGSDRGEIVDRGRVFGFW